MSYLDESKRRERTAERRAERLAFDLSDAQIMREIESAVRAETRRVNVSESEREALAQLAAERILRNRPARRGPAREVLAWIDRAERMPTLCARREGIKRGEVGRNYIGQIVRGLLSDRRDWRDVAESYRTARERQSESGPLVESLEAQSAGWLAVASARESERKHTPRPAPLPEDLRAVARSIANAEPDVTRKQRESIHAALCACLPDALPGPALAVALGCTYGTLRVRVSEGGKLMRDRYSAAELAHRVRATADALALESGERSRVALGTAPHLDAERTVAQRAVDRVIDARKRDGSPRGGYSPATVRAARRNVRAERVSGRWGRATGRALPGLAGKPTRIWQSGESERVPTLAERTERLAEMRADALAGRLAAERRIAAAREVSGYSGR